MQFAPLYSLLVTNYCSISIKKYIVKKKSGYKYFLANLLFDLINHPLLQAVIFVLINHQTGGKIFVFTSNIKGFHRNPTSLFE
jgi:hypothetical protein